MTGIDAYVAAKIALETIPACRREPQAYGFPKCRTHRSGQFLDDSSRCSESGAEGILRDRLDDLVKSISVEVRLS